MPRNSGVAEFSDFWRSCIVGQFEEQISQRNILSNLKIPLSTVNRVAANFKSEGTKTGRSRFGRPEPTERCLRAAKRRMETDSSCKAAHVAQQFDVNCSTTVWYLHLIGDYERAARHKLLLQPVNIERKRWAADMEERPLVFWHCIIFPDESSVAQFSCRGRIWIWKLSNQEFRINRLQPTTKHGGFSVMVWRVIWSTGRFSLWEMYFGILKKYLLPIFQSGQLNERHCLFMEDGAHCCKKYERMAAQQWHQKFYG